MHRSRLPILSPCDQDWDRMAGAGAHRHCAACAREVIDLSAYHAEAAIDLLLARDGKACIRYRHDARGEIQFAPPPPRRPHAAIAALAVAACTGWVDEPAPVPPDESALCIPDADAPNQCDLPPLAAPPVSPAPTPEVPPADPTLRESSAPLAVLEPGLSREFTATVDIAPTVTGDSSGISREELHRLQQEQSVAADSGGIRLGGLFYEEDTPEPPQLTRAELRRLKREARREDRQRRRSIRRAD